jgi:hypothetical protein
MSLTESLWNELVESLPKRILCRAPEDLLSGSVEDDDLLIVIDRNDAVHRRTDYSEQSLLAIPKRLVSPLVLRNVHNRAFDSARLVVGR